SARLRVSARFGSRIFPTVQAFRVVTSGKSWLVAGVRHCLGLRRWRRRWMRTREISFDRESWSRPGHHPPLRYTPKGFMRLGLDVSEQAMRFVATSLGLL